MRALRLRFSSNGFKIFDLCDANSAISGVKCKYPGQCTNFFSHSTVNKSKFNINVAKYQQPKKPEDLIYVDDPDSFGTLSKTGKIFTEKYEHDSDDEKEEKFLSSAPLEHHKLSIKQYSDLIKEHLQNHRIKEAIDVLEIKMLQEDRVKPNNYIYSLLITGCAQVGYTKKAFMLFNDMKRRGVKTTGATYTSLFNACSNSPWPEDGKQRATHLIEHMAEKFLDPNLTNYNSMVKAFGRCGDVQKAFSIVDEMNSKKIKIRVHTFNFLLQSCISDKESGFRHALVTWQKMLSVRERPNVYSFNLLLRCIKECQLGDDITLDILKKSIPNLNLGRSNPDTGQKLLKSQSITSLTSDRLSELEISDKALALCDQQSVDEMPNLLSVRPHMGSVIDFTNIKKPEDKLMLVGGIDCFLEQLVKSRCSPDIKTFTQLLEIATNTAEVDEEILKALKSNKVKPDIDFYNILMKRRSLRCDYEAAKEVYKLVEEYNATIVKRTWNKKRILRPNIMTYGILAMGCTTLEKGKTFLNELKEKRMRANPQIMGTLLKCGAKSRDFDYVMFVMNYVKDENVPINDAFIQHIDRFKQVCGNILKSTSNTPHKTATEESVIKNYKPFVEFHDEWINSVTNKETDDRHPWTQFRENQTVTFQRPTQGAVKGKRYYKKKGIYYKHYVVKM